MFPSVDSKFMETPSYTGVLVDSLLLLRMKYQLSFSGLGLVSIQQDVVSGEQTHL